MAVGETEDVAWKRVRKRCLAREGEMRSRGVGGGRHLFIGVEEEEPDLWFPL